MKIKKWIKSHRKMYLREREELTIDQKAGITRTEKKFMKETNRNIDFFFLDDMDPEKNYISVSVGDVWLYFYKECLIGVRDMRTNLAAFLELKNDYTISEDGYSHRHELTNGIVDGAMHEDYPNAEPPAMLSIEDLTARAITLVADSMSKHIDTALRI